MHFGASVLVLLQGAAARCVAMCALELGRSCCCKVLLPDVWPCARWSLGAGVAALVLPTRVSCSLGSMLASFLIKGNSKLAALRRRRPIIQGSTITEEYDIS